MYDHLESRLCEIAQLYVETRRMRCCASLLSADLQGSKCLLGHLRIVHLMDEVKSVSPLVAMGHEFDVIFKFLLLHIHIQLLKCFLYLTSEVLLL